MKKNSRFLCVFLTLAMLLSLCSCDSGGTAASTSVSAGATVTTELSGNEPSASAENSAGAVSTGAPAELDTSEPVYGGTLRVLTDTDGAGTAGAPWRMNANGAKVLTPCIDTLVKMDVECNILPSLAESWEVAEDKSSVTFHLRNDVSFTDGTRFDADACVWNLKKWQEGGQISMCYAWDEVSALDEYTVKIDLKFYQNNLLSGFTEAFLGFISPTAVEENGEEWCERNVVSTGPFILTELTPGVGWSYVKNKDYWGNEPYLDAIEFTYMGDKNSIKLEMLSGNADLVTWDSSGDFEIKDELVANGFELISYANGSEPTCLYFDSSDPDSPFADEKVRLAVDYAIDKEAIAAIGGSLWQGTSQMVGADSPMYNPDLVRPYDPEKAKELLDEAGYENGFSTQILVEETADQNTIVAVCAFLQDVGIDCEMVVNTTAQQFGAAMSGWSGMIELPCPVAPNYSDSAYSFLGQQSAVAVSLGKPDEMEELLRQAQSCELGEEQHAIVKDLMAYIYDHAITCPLIVATGTVGVRAPYVHSDGWGSLTQGYWSPAECWIEQ